MASNSLPTLLVTGASGQLGRRVVELLLEQRVGKIIATTRTPEGLEDFAARGVDVRKADFDDQGGLVRAFSGAERSCLYLLASVWRPFSLLSKSTAHGASCCFYHFGVAAPAFSRREPRHESPLRCAVSATWTMAQWRSPTRRSSHRYVGKRFELT